MTDVVLYGLATKTGHLIVTDLTNWHPKCHLIATKGDECHYHRRSLAENKSNEVCVIKNSLICSDVIIMFRQNIIIIKIII